MKITIEITCDNDAFFHATAPAFEAEVAHILERLSRRVTQGIPDTGLILRDSNGNNVGKLSITK